MFIYKGSKLGEVGGGKEGERGIAPTKNEPTAFDKVVASS